MFINIQVLHRRKKNCENIFKINSHVFAKQTQKQKQVHPIGSIITTTTTVSIAFLFCNIVKLFVWLSTVLRTRYSFTSRTTTSDTRMRYIHRLLLLPLPLAIAGCGRFAAAFCCRLWLKFWQWFSKCWSPLISNT